MNLHPMKLVTIICEAVLEERIVEVLHECGAHGHTAFDVRGSGRQGSRSADLVESGNVQIQVIAKPAAAEAMLERLHGQFFQDYAMVAYESEVRVMRPDKF
jgi:nitrogen regulatory protein PII